jgi:hypothetical protein
MAATATTVAATAAAMTAAAASRGKLYVGIEGSAVLLVEDVERPQADVGHFLFAEHDVMARHQVLRRRHLHCRSAGRR